jgi:uncharacterized RDD family membrane protein YckC
MNAHLAIPDETSRKKLHSILHRREWTYIIDISFAFLISLMINLLAKKFSPPGGFPYGEVVGLLYILLKDSFSGKSIGKLLTSLRVIDSKESKPAGLGKSLMRNFLFIIPFFPLVELIVANCRKDKKRLGDLIAGTAVEKS